MSLTAELCRLALLANAVLGYEAAPNGAPTIVVVPDMNASPGTPINHGQYPPNYQPPPPMRTGKGPLYGVYV